MSMPWGHVVEILIDKFFSGDTPKFRNLSCEMKVFYCYKNVDIRHTLSQWINDNVIQNSKHLKSSTLSNQFREEGNQKFRIADDEASLTLYSKSVIYAPRGSTELSKALGNRSAVLFRLQKYQECIRDIDFAIENFNDTSLFPKLMARKIKSLCRLKQYEEGAKCLNILKALVDQSDNTSQTHLMDCTKELNQISSTADSITIDSGPPTEFFRGESETFPYASKVLELKLRSENNHHRRVIARETIGVGDIIFIENPFSFVLLPECCEDHCHHCCKLLLAPVACFDCVESLYCNVECMMNARNGYHLWECQGLHFLRNIGVGHLAFRTFLVQSENPNSVHCKQVNELVTHLNDVAETDILSYILTSTLLMIYLEEYTNFTASCGTLSIEGIGFSLLKCMIQIICNAFAIKKPSNDLSMVTYASGMYPSAAMMNHSCEPNVITSFHDNVLVVRANRRIEPGEEVFNCYGPRYRKMNRETRREVLKNQFFFDCMCKHCLTNEDDDTLEKVLCLCIKCQLPFDINEQEATVICNSCTYTTDVQIYIEFFKQVAELREAGMNSMDIGNFEKACELFSQCERLQRTFLERSSKEIFENTLDLAECYYKLGDYENSWKNYYSNITIADKHFDEFDVEWVALISRTIDAFLSHAETANVRKVDNEVEILLGPSNKAVKAAEMNFGAWSKEYALLLEKRQKLMNLRMQER